MVGRGAERRTQVRRVQGYPSPIQEFSSVSGALTPVSTARDREPPSENVASSAVIGHVSISNARIPSIDRKDLTISSSSDDEPGPNQPRPFQGGYKREEARTTKHSVSVRQVDRGASGDAEM